MWPLHMFFSQTLEAFLQSSESPSDLTAVGEFWWAEWKFMRADIRCVNCRTRMLNWDRKSPLPPTHTQTFSLWWGKKFIHISPVHLTFYRRRHPAGWIIEDPGCSALSRPPSHLNSSRTVIQNNWSGWQWWRGTLWNNPWWPGSPSPSCPGQRA